MTAFRIHFLSVMALCVSAAAVALAGSSRVFELPDHGALTPTVPDSVIAGGASAYASRLVVFNLGLYSLYLAAIGLITMAVFAGRDLARRER